MDKRQQPPAGEIITGLTERRLTLRLLAYWERLRGDRLMPVEEDINPDDLHDMWDNCFLIHVQDLIQEDYNYIYLGDSIRNMYTAGLGEDAPEEMLHMNSRALSPSIQKVVDSKRPVIEEAEYINKAGLVVKYRQCLLPLGRFDKVEAVFGGMRYKIYGPGEHGTTVSNRH